MSLRKGFNYLSRSSFVRFVGKNSKNGPFHRSVQFRRLLLAAGTAGAGAISILAIQKMIPKAHALSVHDDEEEEIKRRPKKELTSREQRFVRFASVEYDGQIYMTPRDFLESVTETDPRARIRRKVLTDDEVKRMLKNTPNSKKNSPNFFRTMDMNGLISFTGYLFLLCVLTKPQSGFRIAFNMFDMDGNHRVDKNEFLVIQALTLMFRNGGKIARLDSYLDNEIGNVKTLTAETGKLAVQKKLMQQLTAALEDIMGRGRESLEFLQSENNEEQDSKKAANKASSFDVAGDMAKKLTPQDTTLLVHFFGRNGDQSLSYADFERFYRNLQTEVLEIEFSQYSKGMPTISEMEFAKLLLKYTVVHRDDYNAYLKRVEERIPEEKGITLSQFRQFCHFLNNLDDFNIAVKLYTFANSAINQKEFARAVKVSTGHALDDHVVDTVFKIFDVNDDGELSHSEFIAVMKDRIHRGFRSHLVKGNLGWETFKSCVREELKKF